MCLLKKLLIFFSLFSYSLAFSKTIVISDIDDTLKQANSVGKPAEQVYHFLKKLPYIEMRDLFLEIKQDAKQRNDGIGFFYISAAYSFTFKADKWISKNNFPSGRTVLKNLKEKIPTYDFKHKIINDILVQELKNLDSESNEELTVYMFGDNAQFDAQVYSDLSKELKLKTHIFIRDVKAEATYFDSSIPTVKLPGVNYFFSEIELFHMPEFSFISSRLMNQMITSYKDQSLIPSYTFKTLERKILKSTDDRAQARQYALNFWNDYYTRF